MKEISLKDSFDWFTITLHRLDDKKLDLSDNDLLDLIYEELDIECRTFLHSEVIELLVKNNLISKSVSLLAYELRENLIILIDDRAEADQIRNDLEWKNARQLVTKILSELKLPTL